MDWETFNTSKIKTIFKSNRYDIDLGTKIKFKCHQPIQRIKQTLHGEKCTNWKVFDSFGVRLPEFDDLINHTHDYKNFYDDPPSSLACAGQLLPFGTPCNSEVSPLRYNWDRELGQQLYNIFILIKEFD